MARLLRGISRTRMIGHPTEVHHRIRTRQSKEYSDRDAKAAEERERAWAEERTSAHLPGTSPGVENVRRTADWEAHFT